MKQVLPLPVLLLLWQAAFFFALWGKKPSGMKSFSADVWLKLMKLPSVDELQDTHPRDVNGEQAGRQAGRQSESKMVISKKAQHGKVFQAKAKAAAAAKGLTMHAPFRHTLARIALIAKLRFER